jgi:hypothetical protein
VVKSLNDNEMNLREGLYVKFSRDENNTGGRLLNLILRDRKEKSYISSQLKAVD